jgi:hypothetical protein
MHILKLLLFCILCLGLTACGVKGAPMPRQDEMFIKQSFFDKQNQIKSEANENEAEKESEDKLTIKKKEVR